MLPVVRVPKLVMGWLTWALLSAVFAAATAILAKLGVAGVDSNFATAVRTSVVVLFTWLLAFVVRQPGSFHVPSKNTWFFLGLSGLATGLSWLCYFRALQLGEVAKVAPIDKLSVVVAIVVSVLFLGERLSVRETFGVCLIVGGALFLAWK